MPDLPDYYSQVITLEAEAHSFIGGAESALPASPEARDIYLTEDTDKLYYSVADGAWRAFFMSSRLLTANSLLYAATAYTPAALAVAASRIVGRKSTGNIAALTGAEVMALLSGQAAAAFNFNDQYVDQVQRIRGCDDHHLNIYANYLATATTEKDIIFWTLDSVNNVWIEVFRCIHNGASPTLKMNQALNMNSKQITGLPAPAASGNALRYGNAEIRNAEIAAAAAIAYSKLNLTGLVVMADLAAAIKNAANGLVVLDASADVPDAQIPGLNASKITAGRFPVDRLPAMTDEYYWVGTGANVEERAVPTAPTKEFFVPFTTTGSSGIDEGYERNLPVIIMGTGDLIRFAFKCPHDFTSLTHCKIIGIKATTSNIDWTADTNFAAIGEDDNTHYDSDTADDLAMTDDEFEEVDISAAFTNLSADDYIGVTFTADAVDSGQYHVFGLVFKYS